MCSVFSPKAGLKAATKPPLSRNPCSSSTDRMEPALTNHTLLGQHWWAGKTAAQAKFILNLLLIQSNKAFTTSPGAVLQSGEQKWPCYRNAAPWSCLLLSKHYSDWNTKQIFTLWTQTFNSTGFPAQWWSISHVKIPRHGAVMPEGGTQPCGGAILRRESCSKDGTFLPYAPQLLWLLGWSHRGLEPLLFFLGWIFPKETTSGSDEQSPRRGSSTWWWPRTELCFPGIMQSWVGSGAPQNCDS